MQHSISLPFQFKTVFSLVVLTGRKASTLPQLLHLFEDCEPASIFYHTFRSYGSHHYMKGHYNDVAQWLRDSLGLALLSEQLSNIDVTEFPSIEKLGEKIVETIGDYLYENPAQAQREALSPFYLSSVISAVAPLPYIAYTLEEFRSLLDRVSNHSIYYHYVESRLRVGPNTNDFSLWIEQQLGLSSLANEVNRIDIFTNTIGEIRNIIRRSIDEYIESNCGTGIEGEGGNKR